MKSTATSQRSVARVTLRDIARVVGVSHVTVSLALRNDPSISVRRRAQVQRVARKLGYRPDPMLSSLSAYRQSLRPARFQSVIVWLNRWEDPAALRRFHEFDAYWQGATAEAERLGYRLEEIEWPAQMPGTRLEQILATRNVRGVLIPPCNQSLDWHGVAWEKFSLIRLGMSVPFPGSHLVTTDHFREMQFAVNRMLELGYRRIGLVVERAFDERLGSPLSASFLASQQVRGLRSILPPLLFQTRPEGPGYGEARTQLRQWLRAHRPDAIMTATFQLPRMLEELGLRIPRDVAVAGTSVDDVPVSAGIDQKSVEVGRLAVQMLVAQIHVNERGLPSSPCRVLLEGVWQDGDSMPGRKRG